MWSISEYNLTTRDFPKWTLESRPCIRERRGSGPEKKRAKAQLMYTRRLDMAPGHLCVWLGLAWSCGIHKVSQIDQVKMRNGIVHQKSDRKSCVKPTADRNNHRKCKTISASSSASPDQNERSSADSCVSQRIPKEWYRPQRIPKELYCLYRVNTRKPKDKVSFSLYCIITHIAKVRLGEEFLWERPLLTF